jgi:hypothetical protein
MPFLQRIKLEEGFKNKGKERVEKKRFYEVGRKVGEGFSRCIVKRFFRVLKSKIRKGGKEFERRKGDRSPGDRLAQRKRGFPLEEGF